MCDPVTIALTVTAVAGATQAYGQVQEGKAQNSYYNYLANQNDTEAKLARQQGDLQSKLAQDAGARKASEVATGARVMEGAQKAAVAANMGGGSTTAEDVVGDTFDKSKLDQMMVRYNADQASWEANYNADLNVWDKQNQAAMNRYQGKAAKSAANKQAFGTLLSTAASMATIGMTAGAGTAGKVGTNTAKFGGGVKPAAGTPSGSLSFARVR